MTKKEKAAIVVDKLERRYPDALCSLDYRKPYELLISVRLAAQCTDARVNIVTQDLFKKYPTLESFADADLEELTEMVRPCGFYKVKGKNIKDMCRMLLDEYDGVVPDEIDELLKLPGVGRKTANLIVGDVYGKPAVVTDTHCIRITNRLGLASSDEPVKVEMQLRKCLDLSKSNDFCHRLVLFGRDVCKAQRPRCDECELRDECEWVKHPVKKVRRTKKAV
ncbi:endonuclease III [Feifania hominis]|uniref:Endonuclease III n=1 Tax=Feifania hominis TaxID=2763660 RepID=A0A926HUI5_9FIRM|nr:endonuclease III [Feifania hominis]MBC8536328.1 endonuclease III [Feifania hominis]